MLLLAIQAVHVIDGALSHGLRPPHEARAHYQQVVREQQQNEAGTEHFFNEELRIRNEEF